MLSKLEKVRLANYQDLHGRASIRSHPLVTDLELRVSAVLGTRRASETSIDDATAGAVESVYGLPVGWLSESHELDFAEAAMPSEGSTLPSVHRR